MYGLVVTNTNNHPGIDGVNTSRWGMRQLLWSNVLTMAMLVYGIRRRLGEIAEDQDGTEDRFTM